MSTISDVDQARPYFFLMTETSFHATYLVTKWLDVFEHTGESLGVIARERPMSAGEHQRREAFHQTYAGETNLTGTGWNDLLNAYPGVTKTEQAMIRMFGVPKHSAASSSRTVFLGEDLNAYAARRWLVRACETSHPLFFFVFLDQLLEPWWIDITGSRIINGHSAVLPYARGMYAIENVATPENVEAFERAAGATVHYVDRGIDTGPIIRAERLKDAFRFESIWGLKGYIFTIVFDLLVQVAQEMLDKPYLLPVGTVVAPALRGPNYRSKDFTPQIRARAEQAYINMQARVRRLTESTSSVRSS